MTLKELNQVISLGEGTHIEFKRKVPQPERIVKELIAFANTSGGQLLLGIDDDGSILGVKDAEEEEFALLNALDAHCKPPLSFSSERISITKKRDVIVVRVPPSRNKPHFLIEPDQNESKTAYIRVEDKSIEASREAVRLMRYKKSGKPVTFEFGQNELMLMRYLDTYGKITVSQFAKLSNISRRRASQTLVLMTKANVLRLHAHNKSDYFTIAYEEEGYVR